MSSMLTITSTNIINPVTTCHCCPTTTTFSSCQNLLTTTLVSSLSLIPPTPTSHNTVEKDNIDSHVSSISSTHEFSSLTLPHLDSRSVLTDTHYYQQNTDDVASFDERVHLGETNCSSCCAETRPESPRCIRMGATKRTLTSTSTPIYNTSTTVACTGTRSTVNATPAVPAATVGTTVSVTSSDAAPLTNITGCLFSDEESMPLLECKHWLEVVDPRHRYGTYLRPYYDEWVSRGCPAADTDESGGFFSWLDSEEGRQVDLLRSPSATTRRARPRHVVSRQQLDRCVVRYCDSQSRNKFKVEVDFSQSSCDSCDDSCGGSCGKNEIDDNNSISKSPVLRWAERPGKPLVHTQDGRGGRWIFVIDRFGNMFLNRKVKAAFHHSSFLQGDAVRAAGRIEVVHGVVRNVAPNSGHYMTSMPHLLKGLHDIFGDCELPVTSLTSCDST